MNAIQPLAWLAAALALSAAPLLLPHAHTPTAGVIATTTLLFLVADSTGRWAASTARSWRPTLNIALIVAAYMYAPGAWVVPATLAGVALSRYFAGHRGRYLLYVAATWSAVAGTVAAAAALLDPVNTILALFAAGLLGGALYCATTATYDRHRPRAALSRYLCGHLGHLGHAGATTAVGILAGYSATTAPDLTLAAAVPLAGVYWLYLYLERRYHERDALAIALTRHRSNVPTAPGQAARTLGATIAQLHPGTEVEVLVTDARGTRLFAFRDESHQLMATSDAARALIRNWPPRTHYGRPTAGADGTRRVTLDASPEIGSTLLATLHEPPGGFTYRDLRTLRYLCEQVSTWNMREPSPATTRLRQVNETICSLVDTAPASAASDILNEVSRYNHRVAVHLGQSTTPEDDEPQVPLSAPTPKDPR